MNRTAPDERRATRIAGPLLARAGAQVAPGERGGHGEDHRRGHGPQGHGRADEEDEAGDGARDAYDDGVVQLLAARKVSAHESADRGAEQTDRKVRQNEGVARDDPAIRIDIRRIAAEREDDRDAEDVRAQDVREPPENDGADAELSAWASGGHRGAAGACHPSPAPPSASSASASRRIA